MNAKHMATLFMKQLAVSGFENDADCEKVLDGFTPELEKILQHRDDQIVALRSRIDDLFGCCNRHEQASREARAQVRALEQALLAAAQVGAALGQIINKKDPA